MIAVPFLPTGVVERLRLTIRSMDRQGQNPLARENDFFMELCEQLNEEYDLSPLLVQGLVADIWLEVTTAQI